MFPEKLEEGDEIHVIAPSRSLSMVPKDIKRRSKNTLEKLGLEVTFSENVEKEYKFDTNSLDGRVHDLHHAFTNKNIKAIITAIGGWTSLSLLENLNFQVIESNPKIFCGYSDITAIQNAIYSNTGLVTFSGPNFSTLGKGEGIEYTLKYFKKCLFNESKFYAKPSKKWSDDDWFEKNESREFIENKGYLNIQEGEGEGSIVGGNLTTLNMLQGSRFMPDLKDTILFLEDYGEIDANLFERGIQSLIHLPNFEEVNGIVIGRFERSSGISDEMFESIIKNKEKLKDIPILGNVNFGHTSPKITFPIGGRCRISVGRKKSEIEILEH